jgi:hypothetical protein
MISRKSSTWIFFALRIFGAVLLVVHGLVFGGFGSSTLIFLEVGLAVVLLVSLLVSAVLKVQLASTQRLHAGATVRLILAYDELVAQSAAIAITLGSKNPRLSARM